MIATTIMRPWRQAGHTSSDGGSRMRCATCPRLLDGGITITHLVCSSTIQQGPTRLEILDMPGQVPTGSAVVCDGGPKSEGSLEHFIPEQAKHRDPDNHWHQQQHR